jgi:hypothetical protein
MSAINLGATGTPSGVECVCEAVVNYRVDAAIAEQNLGDARSRGIPTESGGEVGNEDIADFEQLMGEGAGREDRPRATLRIRRRGPERTAILDRFVR